MTTKDSLKDKTGWNRKKLKETIYTVLLLARFLKLNIS